MRAIIVDDEPQAREIIRLLLEQEPDVEIIDECDNGLDAVIAITTKKPDVVFLDIQMPEMNGFEVAEKVSSDTSPYIIFVTAFDEYAIQAFEISAVDYILKPYDDARFFKALDKARAQIQRKDGLSKQDVSHLLDQYTRQQENVLRHLSIRVGSKVLFVEDRSIEWIEAADQYCKIHTAKGDYMVRESLRFYEEKLDPSMFYRAHRSAIVNLSAIKELQPFKKSRYAIILKNGQLVELGPAKLEELKKRMEHVRL